MSAGEDGVNGGDVGRDNDLNATSAERRASAAADLILSSEVLHGPSPLPDFAGMLSRRGWRSRRSLWMTGTAAALAVCLIGFVSLRNRTVVSYVVDGPIVMSGDLIEALGTGPDAPARVRFSEGTEVALEKGARLRVLSRDVHGAALVLEGGRAGFAVTHRRGARWTVATGPFTVDVVGTRFSMDWAPGQGRMVVDLNAGKVLVRGATVGGPLEMHPGERLVATLEDHRVTLLPLPGAGEAKDEREVGLGRLVTRSPSASTGSPPSTESSKVSTESRASGKGLRRARRMELALTSPSRASTGAKVSPGAGVVPLDLKAAEGTPSSMPANSLTPPAPTPPAAAAPHSELQPSPVAAPVNPTTTLGGGGVFCSREAAQYGFEQSAEDSVAAASVYTLALANPERDATHSWCGDGSVRFRANFTEQGRRNYFGRFLRETGQMVIRLDRPTDFTERTVTMHVFVEGPSDARFSAEVFVVHRGHWVGSEPMRELTPGRWWTIKHKFKSANPTGGSESSNPQPYPGEGLSPVSDCNRVSLAIRSTGTRRNWSGSVYVDDVGWR